MYGGGVMPGRRAGSGIGKYNAEGETLCPSGYVIYQCQFSVGQIYFSALVFEQQTRYIRYLVADSLNGALYI